MAQLAQCEFAVGKTLMAYEMNEHETQNYENIYSEIGTLGLNNFITFGIGNDCE